MVYVFNNFFICSDLSKAGVSEDGPRYCTIVPKGSPDIRKTVKKKVTLSVNRVKCVFATKQPMFRVLAIVEILYYCGWHS